MGDEDRWEIIVSGGLLVATIPRSREWDDMPDGRHEVVLASALDQQRLEIEKADEFLKRADRALIGTAGVEAADDDAMDRARSYMLAARSALSTSSSKPETET